MAETDEVKKNPWWNAAKFFLKLLISGVALYFVFRKVDFRETVEKISTLSLLPFIASIVVFNISKIISTWRIKYFLKALGTHIGNKLNIKLYYIGSFYNLYLPGSIGGDGYKVWLMKKWFGLPSRKLISVVFLDRLSGVVALASLTVVMLYFSSFRPDIPAWNGILFAALLVIYPVYYFAFNRFFPDFKPAFHAANNASLVSQVTQVLCAWLILLSLDAQGNPWDYISLFMIGAVVSVLPFTIGGLGAREYVLAHGAGYVLIDENTAVSFALLFFFITAMSSFAGLVFAFGKKEVNARTQRREE